MGPVLPLLVIAQADQLPNSVLGWLTGSAVTVLAFITWAWMTGRIHSDKDYQRIVTELTRVVAEKGALEVELRRRAQEDRDALIPALTRATDVLSRWLERKVSDQTPPPEGRRR